MPRGHFSREEAERLLPRLVPLVEEMRGHHREHVRLRHQAVDLEAKMKGNGHSLGEELARLKQGMEKTAMAVNGLIERMQSLGCEVKDVEMGLLDFRTMMDGREVYLCWKLGEERIAWWHELDTGYASRQPLE